MPEDPGPAFRLAATFHPPEKRFADFCAASAVLPPSPVPGALSSGFPGGEPAWDADLVARSEFLRANAANDAGLRCGVAFPIRIGTDLIATLEFFSAQNRDEDAPLVDKLAGILPRAARPSGVDEARTSTAPAPPSSTSGSPSGRRRSGAAARPWRS